MKRLLKAPAILFFCVSCITWYSGGRPDKNLRPVADENQRPVKIGIIVKPLAGMEGPQYERARVEMGQRVKSIVQSFKFIATATYRESIAAAAKETAPDPFLLEIAPGVRLTDGSVLYILAVWITGSIVPYYHESGVLYDTTLYRFDAKTKSYQSLAFKRYDISANLLFGILLLPVIWINAITDGPLDVEQGVIRDFIGSNAEKFAADQR